MNETNKVIVLPHLRGGKIENAVNTSNVAIKDVEAEQPDNYIHYYDGHKNLYNELSDLISNIHGESQLIELYVQNDKDIDKKPLTNNIDSIKKNCLKLTKSLNNMIELKRIEEKQLCLCVNNVNIVEIIENIVINSSNNIKGKKIIFDTNIEEKFMTCDIDKIQKTILILLSNAIKFSSEKEVTVNLQILKNSIDITITFKNTNRNLLNFFIDKMDNLNKNSFEDLSIGFHICKSIIKLHEGQINLYGNGEEVSFLVQLPCENTDLILYLYRNNNLLNIENLTEQIQIEFSDLY